MSDKKSSESESVGMKIDCPNCSKKCTLRETQHHVENFGKVLLSSLSCQNCGFRFNDVSCMQFSGPKAFEARIEKTEDLETKIIRSSSGAIRIPELGVEITPGVQAEGYISNIEGLLDRIEAVVESALKENIAQEKAGNELQLIKDAKKVKSPFTVILEDPLGNSALVGKKAKERPLSAKDIERLQNLL